MNFTLDFRRAWWPGVRASGRIKMAPEDFVVEELMGDLLTGSGEHLCLQIRKTGQNTQWVAGQLARIAGVGEKDVGYAGRKDRHAVTTQWFSVPVAEIDADQVGEVEGCALLQTRRHARKLRPGDHSGNRFRIGIRDLQGDLEERREVLEQLRHFGFPNYFGVQRFGREGANLERGWAMLTEGRRLRGRQGGIYLSSLRSWLFNCVLDAHIRAGHWPAIISDGEENPWTGPLWGRGRAERDAREEGVEAGIVEAQGTLCHALEFCGLNQERRALCLRPQDFVVESEDGGSLTLGFTLPPGAFATELLAELIGPQHRL